MGSGSAPAAGGGKQPSGSGARIDHYFGVHQRPAESNDAAGAKRPAYCTGAGAGGAGGGASGCGGAGAGPSGVGDGSGAPPSKVARAAGAGGGGGGRGGGGKPSDGGKPCTQWRALCWIARGLGEAMPDEVTTENAAHAGLPKTGERFTEVYPIVLERAAALTPTQTPTPTLTLTPTFTLTRCSSG